MERTAGTVVKRRKRNLKTIIWRQRWLFLMSVPFLIWLVIFKYIPLWGWTMAFQDVKASTFSLPIWERTFVGFDNFTKAFNDRQFNQVIINTLGISLMDIFIGTFFAIMFALFLNELKLMNTSAWCSPSATCRTSFPGLSSPASRRTCSMTAASWTRFSELTCG